jgi:hypothetical protein
MINSVALFREEEDIDVKNGHCSLKPWFMANSGLYLHYQFMANDTSD